MVNHGFQSIHDLFSQVSSSYDVMNDLMSLGTHHLWKAELVDTIQWPTRNTVHDPVVYVDMACGTGDVGLRVWAKTRSMSQSIHITLVDPNPSLLTQARHRAEAIGAKRAIHWLESDALRADISPNTVDVYTMSFGLRNMDAREEVLRRVWEQLRPGGRFYCLEFSHPSDASWRTWYQMYLQWLPVMGQVVANNAPAYAYLRDSIKAFPPAHELVDLYQHIGFVHCVCRPMTQGIVAITGGMKP